MQTLIYSLQNYEINYFKELNHKGLELGFTDKSLNAETVDLAKGFEAVSCFVLDCLDESILKKLKDYGIKLIALRSAGFDHVDLQAAKKLGLVVVRVPAYSPHAVAEFTIALILMLIRKLDLALQQSKSHNFCLENLMGENLSNKTVGIIGTGHIGSIVAKILSGFGCQLLAYDLIKNPLCIDLGVCYVDQETLLKQADIISLHCPLTNDNHHLINSETLKKIKLSALLINTARGGLIDTSAVITALKEKKLAGLAIDVYEQEQGLFFKNHTGNLISDKKFLELESLPNVIITAHQAFLTAQAVANIIETTLNNIIAFSKGRIQNEVV